MASSEEYDVKREVAIANRILSNLGLATGVTADRGHASMRLPSDDGRFAVKGRQYAIDSLSSMRPEDMIICDTDGFLVDGPDGVVQCAEIKIHSCIYQLRPDVQSVVHVHPRFTVLLSTLGQKMTPLCQEGMQLVRDPLPVWPHVKIIQSHDEGMEVANLLGDGSVVLLFAHGAVTAGGSLSESVMAMAELEEQARMNYLALCALGRDYPSIPEELIQEITGRPPLWELDHFKGVIQEGGLRMSGIWNYHAAEAARGL
ncbi:MAG: class II aldolase/adducin family protein [Chloroflexi bacterium]|nr:class II aldolase/adducin family protein [Chloroflexota bacterium]